MRALAAFTWVLLLACGPKVGGESEGSGAATGPPKPDDGGDLPACERCVFGDDGADTDACACSTFGCFELLEWTNACWSADEECLADCCADASPEAQEAHDAVRDCQQSACAGVCPDGVGRRCA